MHKIEEILSRLNQRASVIEPSTVAMLEKIQQRLSAASAASASASAEPSPAIGAPSKAGRGPRHPVPQTETTTAASAATVQQSALLQAIIESNRKHLASTPAPDARNQAVGAQAVGAQAGNVHGAHRHVESPKFAATKTPLATPAHVTVGGGGMGRTNALDMETGNIFVTQAAQWPPLIALANDPPDAGWAAEEHAALGSKDHANRDASLAWQDLSTWKRASVQVLDWSDPADDDFRDASGTFDGQSTAASSPVSLKFPTADQRGSGKSLRPDSDSFAQQATANDQPTAADTVRPPSPHFASAPSKTTPPSQPIFSSVWFRRSAPNTETAAIVQRILEKVPPVAPATLLFTAACTSKSSPHLVATQIAWELSRRVTGEVLLVDADFARREISRQLDNVYLPGLGEMLNLNVPLSDCILPSGVEGLSWLPSGTTDVSFRKSFNGRWSEISTELKQHFQYICIFGGAAEDKVVGTWGRFCDFSFLIASMLDDLGEPSLNLVNHLRRHDCRLSGLITVD